RSRERPRLRSVWRQGAAPDARARLLRPPGVVARRPAHCGDQGPARSAHQRADGPGYELAWLPAAGGPTTRITPIVGGGRPHFSRDPNRIYLYEANEGLVSMRYDGTDRRVHIKVTGFTLNLPDAQPFPADEILIAPDSSRVLATASNYVYLVTLPLVGATPPAINVADTSAVPFPVHRLTRIGGDFIGWGSDGRTVQDRK